jgi:hypothetical protein
MNKKESEEIISKTGKYVREEICCAYSFLDGYEEANKEIYKWKSLCRELVEAMYFDVNSATWTDNDTHYALIEKAEKELQGE